VDGRHAPLGVRGRGRRRRPDDDRLADVRRWGIAAGDRITRVARRTISTTQDLLSAIGDRKPGDTVRVTWIARTGETSALMKLGEDPNVEVVAFEDAGRTPTAAQLAFRAAWVGSRQR
jgi:predicted metalloprotease with PDZ domain